jgi:protein-S-isoprenylcysteine O-methyltransferase Ste14
LTNIDTDRKSQPPDNSPVANLGGRQNAPVSALEWLVTCFCWAGGLVFVTSLAVYLYAYLVRFGRPAPAGSAVFPAAMDAVLFTVFATHHSVFARLGVKQRIERAAPRGTERSIFTWVASLLFLLVCLAWQPVPGVLYALQGWAAWTGYALQAAGILLTIRGSAAIDVLDLAGVRQVLDVHGGRPPRHAPLETGGVYSLVRHPIYFGWALFVFGAPHMTATRLVFAVVSTAYLAIAIPWEERRLTAVFGDQYRAYQRRVRWRMVPGVY